MLATRRKFYPFEKEIAGELLFWHKYYPEVDTYVARCLLARYQGTRAFYAGILHNDNPYRECRQNAEDPYRIKDLHYQWHIGWQLEYEWAIRLFARMRPWSQAWVVEAVKKWKRKRSGGKQYER